MDIIQRNFFRLIRVGVFEKQEQVEPMSAYKWSKLYQLAMMHQVAGDIYKGLLNCKNQFFFHLTDKQWNLWENTINELQNTKENDEEEEDELLKADHLTNPLLNRKFQTILDDENSDTRTRQLLLMITRTSRHILNEGFPVRQLVALGSYIRKENNKIDYAMLGKWLQDLRLQKIAQLQGALLTEWFGFESDEIPFASKKTDPNVIRIAQELIEFTNARVRNFYFTQDADSIFVHTNNGSAMLGHMRRSTRYFRYYPSETLTNFFASFAHSLSHIEE